MLVTIVIPCYNAAPWLAQALDSCLEQEHGDIEIIVVDDGSTDGSLDVARRYQANDPERVRLLCQSHRGSNAARNRGYRASRGRLIQWLDADDCLLPSKLRRHVEFLSHNPQVDVVYSDFRFLRELPGGAQLVTAPVRRPVSGDMLETLLADHWRPPHAFLARRLLLERVDRAGGWCTARRSGDDRDYWTRVALAGGRFAYTAGADVVYRRHGTSRSTGRVQQRYEEQLRILAWTEAEMDRRGMWTPRRRQAFRFGKLSILRHLSRFDSRAFRSELARLAARPNLGRYGRELPWSFRAVSSLLGVALAMRVADATRELRRPHWRRPIAERQA